MRLSVAIPVCQNDSVIAFKEAMDSIIHQTVKADEIILVADGPISDDLKSEILKYQNHVDELHPIFLEKNQTLGGALRIAIETAKGEYVARMDSDDRCLTNRFELQLDYLDNHPEISVVGGMISEFVDGTEETVGKRLLPLEDKDIKQYMRSRNGVNHVTVMFRRNDIIAAGNYQPYFYMEDYFLWSRMMKLGYKFANLPEVLVNVRVSKEMYARRGGWKIFKSEWNLYRFMMKQGQIDFVRFILNILERGTVHFLMPNKLRTMVYQHLLRK